LQRKGGFSTKKKKKALAPLFTPTNTGVASEAQKLKMGSPQPKERTQLEG